MQIVLPCIDNIHPRYYVEPMTALQAGQIVNQPGQRANESTYVSQLFSATQNALHGQDLHLDRFFQTNQPKQLIFQQADYQQKYSSSFEQLFNPSEEEHSEFYKIPDIVIHNGPEDFERGKSGFYIRGKDNSYLIAKTI